MKFLRILSRTLGIILFALVAVVLILKAYGYISFRGFYQSAKKVCAIPGLSDDFVPQGLAIDSASGTYLVCGYAKDGKSSVYLKNDDGVRRVIMEGTDGAICTDHFGGIAISGDYLFLSGGDGSSNGHQFVYTYKLSEVLSLKDMDAVLAMSTSDVSTGTAFLYAESGLLYVGEFNHNGSAAYEIQDESHYFNVSETESHKALMLAYTINASGTLSENPVSAYSLPDDVQGFTKDSSGKCYFSASWAVNPSDLYVYNSLADTPDSSVLINGTSVPVWYFKKENLSKDIKVSQMLEGIYYMDSKIYTVNESASYKYIFGKLFRGGYIYSYSI